MTLNAFKAVLPNLPVPTRVLRGPFRGAVIVMNPRHSLRKVFGLYEHELNSWLERALRRVNRVLDIGANDGYFSFGCAAAFERLEKRGHVIGFEPQAAHVRSLCESILAQGRTATRFEVIQALVSCAVGNGMTTLDTLPIADRRNTLVKIDVEGAEIDVVEGAQSWIGPSNLFLIEVHEESSLDRLKQTFAGHGHRLVQLNQRPLPLLGREARKETNWWLVSDLDATS
jgi:hypothetical protein